MGAKSSAGLSLDQVEGDLCTHIVLDSLRVSSSGCLIVGSSKDEPHVTSHLTAVRDFKRRHQNRVKVMISVSNDENNNNFAQLASSPELRQTFAKSAVEFLQQYHLDGLDLNWKYPNFPTNFLLPRDQERTGLTKIVKALRSAMVENFYDRQQHELAQRQTIMMPTSGGSLTGQPPVEPHLLTVAIAGQESVLRASYELRQLANLCDWLNVMSYDYFLFKAYAPFTGPNAPLHPVVDHYVPILNKLALSWTAARLLDEGLDPQKIVMGIPTYARAYRLVFRNSAPAPFALSVGVRPPVEACESHQDTEVGCLNYAEVLEILSRDDTRVEFDERARVPYLVTDTGYTWISYENPRSVREKVHYILGLNLGGYMTWSLNSDDHHCGAQQNGRHQMELQSPNEPQNGEPNGTPNGTPNHDEHDNISPTTTTTTTTNKFPLHRAMLDELAEWLASRTKLKTGGDGGGRTRDEPPKSRL